MFLKVFLVIIFVLLVFIAAFCMWVLCIIAGRSSHIEEQMEIERKLRNRK